MNIRKLLFRAWLMLGAAVLPLGAKARRLSGSARMGPFASWLAILLAFAPLDGAHAQLSSAPVTAKSPALAPYMRAPNRTLYGLGDSRVGIEQIFQTTGSPYPYAVQQNESPIGWALRFLGDKINFDMSKQGYAGANGTLAKINVVPNTLGSPLAAGNGGGTGYSGSSTCTVGGAGGATVSSPVVDGNGSILSIAIMAAGAGYTSIPAVTCTGGTGLNAFGVLAGTGTFGQSGATCPQIYTLIPDLEAVAVPGDLVNLVEGTNDELAGLTLAASTACAKLTDDRLLADGYYVIQQLDSSRLQWGTASDATAPAPQYRKQLYARREWLKRYVQNGSVKNNNGYQHIYLYDIMPETTDLTSAYGDPRTGYTADGLHPAERSAYIAGSKIAAIISGLLPTPPSVQSTTSCAEVLDATYNPFGPVQGNPCMTGTAGTMPASAGGLTVSGTAPTGWTLTTSGTTGTQTLTGGIETGTRTDGLNGARSQFAVSCGGSGSATQLYTLALPGFTTFASMGLSSATNGTSSAPKIRMDVDYEVSGQLLMNTPPTPTLKVFSTNSTVYTSEDGAPASSASFPIADTGVNDGLVTPLGAGVVIHAQTPSITLNNIGTAAGAYTVVGTQVQVTGQLQWGFNCSGAAGTGGGTLKINRVSIHLVA